MNNLTIRRSLPRLRKKKARREGKDGPAIPD
jgi:hypothetical protein